MYTRSVSLFVRQAVAAVKNETDMDPNDPRNSAVLEYMTQLQDESVQARALSLSFPRALAVARALLLFWGALCSAHPLLAFAFLHDTV